ncbi:MULTISPECIES: hypothetical protein [Alkalimonas]|uniref:Uncharacterized protein n=2 Tax=Alkalimonas TaxID=265980 RepID=A0A1H4A7W0_ALKAM|nr:MULTISPECIES: hypothetical protein [Alkalimonas]MEE2024983.1 hypothetical protein [Alkalimonas sp. MEB004]SEA32233.1 hypothetical protein SAMN04488051_102540 [Alkalimonas amylolytica]
MSLPLTLVAGPTDSHSSVSSRIQDAHGFHARDAITPYVRYRASPIQKKRRFHGVVGVSADVLDDTLHPGGYLAVQGRSDDFFTEIGVLGQRLPRSGTEQPDKTRYFMTVRLSMNQPIGPYGMIGFNPLQWLQWLDSEEDMRLDLHAQAGLSWQSSGSLLRLDAYGAMYSFESRRPYDPTESRFDRDRKGDFVRSTQWGAGLRFSLMF